MSAFRVAMLDPIVATFYVTELAHSRTQGILHRVSDIALNRESANKADPINLLSRGARGATRCRSREQVVRQQEAHAEISVAVASSALRPPAPRGDRRRLPLHRSIQPHNLASRCLETMTRRSRPVKHRLSPGRRQHRIA